MALLFSRASRCLLVEFLYSIISMYPPACSSVETVSDTVNRLYSTGFWGQLSYENSLSVVHA